ncbi:putative defense protein [Amblyomma americanum]
MAWNATSWIAALSLVLSTPGACLAFPDGAPGYVCDDMLPFHQGSQQLNGSDSPYQFVQEKAAFQPNDSITVTLFSKSAYFRGFMVKALDEHDNQVGHFQRGAIYKPVEDCSAATHVNKHKKNVVKMLWKAPASTEGKVHFIATVVHNFRLFYLDLRSKTKSGS